MCHGFLDLESGLFEVLRMDILENLLCDSVPHYALHLCLFKFIVVSGLVNLRHGAKQSFI